MSNFLNFAGNSGVTFKNHGTGGGTSFTLDKSASTNSVLLSIGGIIQKPSTDYTVSGTAITTTSSVTSGVEVFSLIIHDAGNAPVIEDNSIVTAKIADNQVTTAKIADNNVTGAKIAMGSDAAGDVLYYNGTDYVRLAKGTATQVLAMNSGATAPEWVAAGGGSLNFVSSVNYSGNSVAFSSMDEYESYFIRFERMVGDSISENRIQLSQAGGSYITASSYTYADQAYSQSGTPSYVSRGADHIPLTAADGGSKYMSGWMYVYLKGKSATGTMIHAQTFGEEQATGFETGRVISGMLDTGTIMDGIKIYRNSGDFSSGQLYLYGLSNS